MKVNVKFSQKQPRPQYLSNMGANGRLSSAPGSSGVIPVLMALAMAAA
jgi:hypothetical protein